MTLGIKIFHFPSYLIFKTLNVGPPKKTKMASHLADRSIVTPKYVLDDILVQVNETIFLINY